MVEIDVLAQRRQHRSYTVCYGMDLGGVDPVVYWMDQPGKHVLIHSSRDNQRRDAPAQDQTGQLQVVRIRQINASKYLDSILPATTIVFPNIGTESMTSEKFDAGNNRRRLLKLAAFGGIVAAGYELPKTWTRPIVDVIALPAHAGVSDKCTEDVDALEICDK